MEGWSDLHTGWTKIHILIIEVGSNKKLRWKYYSLYLIYKVKIKIRIRRVYGFVWINLCTDWREK
jgi:hypothetical protein